MADFGIFVLILVVVLVILTVGSAFFAGSEIALFSLSSAKLRTYQHHTDRRKRLIAHLLSHPHDLLVTIYIFNTIVNILIQNVASTLFGVSATWWLKVGVPLVLTLIFGEVIPKFLALQKNTWVAYHIAHPIAFFQDSCKPLRQLITTITTPISRSLFFFLKEDETISRDELQHVLQESKERGVLHKDEVDLIYGYLDLREASIKEVMRPREDILFYDINDPLSQLAHLFVDLECSRVPVSNGEINNTLGILDARDYFVHYDTLKTVDQLKPLLKKPVFVPETASAPAILRQFEREEHPLALVVDEYGSITGLLTREDLSEEVVGDITDRRDEKRCYTPAGKNVIIASGKMELDDIEDVFNIKLHSQTNVKTIGGWLTEQLGDIPKSGRYFQTQDFLFNILAADPNRVRRVYIRKLSPPAGSGTSSTKEAP